MVKDKKDLEDRIYDISSELEDLLYEVRHLKSDVLDPDEPASDINSWKNQIIHALPKECSVKFRLDVEKALEQFQNVY